MSRDLESRIAVRERSDRRLRLTIGLVALAAVGLSTLAVTGEAPALETLRVRSLDSSTRPA